MLRRCAATRSWAQRASPMSGFLIAPATASAQRVEDAFFNSVIPSRVDHLIGFTPTTFAIHPRGQRLVPIKVRVGGRTHRYVFGNAAAVVGPSADIYLRNMIRGRRYPSPQGIFLDRRLTAAERRHVQVRVDLGRDADVLAVRRGHPACASGVSRAVARGIAAGTIRTWSAAGVPAPESGDAIALRRAGNGIERSVEPRFAAGWRLPTGSRAAPDGGLLEAAAGNLAIAAVTSWSRARALQHAICAIAVGGSAPSDTSVRALSHPDAYPVSFVTLRRLRDARPIVAAFATYLTGPQGRLPSASAGCCSSRRRGRPCPLPEPTCHTDAPRPARGRSWRTLRDSRRTRAVQLRHQPVDHDRHRDRRPERGRFRATGNGSEPVAQRSVEGRRSGRRRARSSSRIGAGSAAGSVRAGSRRSLTWESFGLGGVSSRWRRTRPTAPSTSSSTSSPLITIALRSPARRGDHLRSGVDRVAGRPDAGLRWSGRRVTSTSPVLASARHPRAASGPSHVRLRSGRMKTRVAWDECGRREPDTGSQAIVARRRGARPFRHDSDAPGISASRSPARRLGVNEEVTSSDHWRTNCACNRRPPAGPEHAERLVRTSQPWQYGQSRRSRPQRSRAPTTSGRTSVAPVARSTRGRPDRRAAREAQREAGRRVHHAVLDDLHAVAPDLGPRGAERLGRGHPVAGQEPLHVRGGGVPRRSRVDDHDPAPRPAEHERRAQPGGPASDDRHVIDLTFHALSVHAAGGDMARFVAVSGNRR